MALQSQLEGTENRITVARRDYNEAVRDYNTSPAHLPDRAVGHHLLSAAPSRWPCSRANAAAQSAPVVDFGTPGAAPGSGRRRCRLRRRRRAGVTRARGPRSRPDRAPPRASVRAGGLRGRAGGPAVPGSHRPGGRRRPRPHAAAQADLTAKLAALEQQTTPPAGGRHPAQPRRLRHRGLRQPAPAPWGIGQKATNNGALFIVVPSEHKVRIEVGYGLEDVLTDALSSVILQRKVLPNFRAGDIPGGVVDGTDAIIEQLGADPTAGPGAGRSRPKRRRSCITAARWARSSR